MLLSRLTKQSIHQLINLKNFRRFATTVIERDPRFNSVTDSDIRYFKDVLGDAGVVTDPHDLIPFNRDWMGKYEGSSSVALKPRTTAQVSALVSHCASRHLAIVPQGGNTGLVGGSVPVFDEVILSTAAMNTITSFDPFSGIAVCQAGCILETLDTYLAPLGHTVPLDLGAKGSCHIGGNVATNAGGLRLLRYGSLHGSVLGLEVVLADGQVVDMLSTLRKDNTGYDLKQLFIGSEGTLGVITAVSLLCPPRPTAVHVAYLTVPSFQAALQTLQLARKCLGEVLSAFEFVDAESLGVVLEYLPGARDPLPGSNAPFGLVIETSGSDPSHDASKLDSFLDLAMSQSLISDGVVAQDEAQAAAIWRVREGVTEALRHRGAIYKYDVSMPIQEMYGLVEDMRERLEGMFPGGKMESGQRNGGGKDVPITVVGYGHMGDGNLHLNISAPSYHPDLLAAIEPFVYEWIAARRGSISAEHGLGVMKAGSIRYSKSAAAVGVMQGIKGLLDPLGIMNPYKVLPMSTV